MAWVRHHSTVGRPPRISRNRGVEVVLGRGPKPKSSGDRCDSCAFPCPATVDRNLRPGPTTGRRLQQRFPWAHPPHRHGRRHVYGLRGRSLSRRTNSIPVDHQALGMSLLNFVGPLDADGPAGKIGFMGVGVSTTGRDWDAFASLVSGESGINPQVVLARGTVSGHPIANWLQPSDFPWGQPRRSPGHLPQSLVAPKTTAAKTIQ